MQVVCEDIIMYIAVFIVMDFMNDLCWNAFCLYFMYEVIFKLAIFMDEVKKYCCWNYLLKY